MRNTILLAAIGAALALAPAAAMANGQHTMMKKHHAKSKKGTPMQNAGTVGEKSGGSDNGPNTNNMGTNSK